MEKNKIFKDASFILVWVDGTNTILAPDGNYYGILPNGKVVNNNLTEVAVLPYNSESFNNIYQWGKEKFKNDFEVNHMGIALVENGVLLGERRPDMFNFEGELDREFTFENNVSYFKANSTASWIAFSEHKIVQLLKLSGLDVSKFKGIPA
jgi:hypothetical protein